ncbi:hypothetical protein LTSEURB_4115 [Salmonella enterica subsp. enterica serovar Urbana str. R8-2977]|uniref:Uncharacterized protein n=1 Tax=Salmonella enterica subsp. enterica serovar Urbana str. R8-2977 TaxID=913084 RepID=G5RZ94_SALET|nr:hypothetical protein LTSEJOH_4038 [Salmonella enterica subsp. enterica serovar Johannesburg str. S5-703]EHD00699.1 hypothetical protein LTSEURB_4115 [Salmonella enterica subsp. enterica serovar Urbana str. R8-2977]
MIKVLVRLKYNGVCVKERWGGLTTHDDFLFIFMFYNEF